MNPADTSKEQYWFWFRNEYWFWFRLYLGWGRLS